MKSAANYEGIQKELEEMLDNLGKVKSPEYGMILRSFFNLHNTTLIPIFLLDKSGVLDAEQVKNLKTVREAALGDCLLTIMRLHFKGKEQIDEQVLKMIQEIDNDLKMLLLKQQEYSV